MDRTEPIRRQMVQEINSQVQSNSYDDERKRLEVIHGKIWDTDKISKEFEITGFMAPFVVVIQKANNKKGTLQFQHHPRFYFNFQEF